jgi:uncharacterized membrane protein YfcA
MSLSSMLPEGISVFTLVALMAVALLASMARGFSGFGSALIFMPLASTVAAPRTVAALLLIIDLVCAAPLAPNAWRQGDRKAVGLMAIGALITVPIGTYALTQLNPVTTRWIIIAFVTALLVLLISGWRYHGKGHPTLSVGVGGLAGFCSGLAQTGGPPIVAYWLGQPIAGALARANIVLYFAMTDIISFGTYTAAGLISWDVVKLSLLVGPVYGLGLFMGARLFGVASETLFRRVCYSLIALAAIVSLPVLDQYLGR